VGALGAGACDCGLIGGYLIILQRQSTTAEAMLATRARQLAVANAALYREVSERAVAEALAVAERGQLQSILNTTVDAIITIDGRGVIQSFNSAAQSTFGYAPNEVIGQNVSMLMPEPDHSAHDQYLSNYQNAGEARIIGTGREVTGLRKDGRRFPLELSVSEVPVSEGKLYTGIVRDRSVRKAAEAALAFSEARFRLLFESSPVGITFSSGTDGIEQVSPAMLRMLERSEGEVLGRILADFDDESYSQARTDSRVQIMPGQTDSTVSERLLKRASGAPLWVQIQAGAFRNEKNEVVGVVRTVEDITQRKAAESEARLRAMLESAPIGMAWSTPGESLQTVNPKFREILGRTAEEIAGHKLSDFSAPGGTQRRTSTSEILSDGLQDAVTQERQLVRGDGRTIWVAVTASAVRQPDGRINGVLRMVEDITERRQAEKDLRASEERFRVLIESAPVGIMVSHEHDSATLANPALAAMLGVPSDLVLGKRLTDYWYPRYEQQRSGSRAVRRLRQKLRATESNEIIRTHRGLGYSFIQAD
jgi:PAS domain S-box-containing protein